MRDNTRPIVITVAESDPILLADAHGDLALASRDRLCSALICAIRRDLSQALSIEDDHLGDVDLTA